ncbi:MAG: hypothetical protein HC933_15570 [Pleurocapsa sp. SU_196_0]|nr:hypothetical protein [Pleurocapsa sp. SU_196_0]
MTKRTVQLVLGVLLTLSLIPALILAWQRIQFERAYDTVGLTIDYQDVVIQARENGLTEEALLEQYKALGINGVSLFEDSLSRLVQQDKVIYRDGGSWRNERLSLGLDVSAIQSRETYLRSLVPGEAERFRAKYRFPTRTVRIDGNDWIAFPLEVGGLPAGPNLELISRLEALGFFVAYRPYEASSLADPGADFPEVPFIVYAGDSVTGGQHEAEVAEGHRAHRFDSHGRRGKRGTGGHGRTCPQEQGRARLRHSRRVASRAATRGNRQQVRPRRSRTQSPPVVHPSIRTH